MSRPDATRATKLEEAQGGQIDVLMAECIETRLKHMSDLKTRARMNA
ncbi:hypothetical protein [Modicisalibacter luteus]|nr:hypothetical protein [Halomonas lutea]GHB13860.1 hypothetical protein GCM10007159_40230 [Halomonas lutea]